MGKKDETFNYVLCESWESKDDGIKFKSTVDLNKCKDIDDFLSKVVKKKELNEKDAQNVASVYWE